MAPVCQATTDRFRLSLRVTAGCDNTFIQICVRRSTNLKKLIYEL